MIESDKIIKQYINDTTTSFDFRSVHYLPHRAVVRQNRDTTKVRIVFYASVHVDNEPSLNDVLYSGPCMLLTVYVLYSGPCMYVTVYVLHDVLIRFRIGKIGIVADVQQTFLQIEVEEKHWDFLRFIWFDSVLSKNPSYVLLDFARVVFGLTCSPFLFKRGASKF